MKTLLLVATLLLAGCGDNQIKNKPEGPDTATVEAKFNHWSIYSIQVDGGKVYFSYHGGMAFVPERK